MWYEILPSAAIITVALAIPLFGTYGINKLVLDNGNRRLMEQSFQQIMYRRDKRLTGNVYNMNGLESIPDKED